MLNNNKLVVYVGKNITAVSLVYIGRLTTYYILYTRYSVFNILYFTLYMRTKLASDTFCLRLLPGVVSVEMNHEKGLIILYYYTVDNSHSKHRGGECLRFIYFFSQSVWEQPIRFVEQDFFLITIIIMERETCSRYYRVTLRIITIVLFTASVYGVVTRSKPRCFYAYIYIYISQRLIAAAFRDHSRCVHRRHGVDNTRPSSSR